MSKGFEEFCKRGSGGSANAPPAALELGHLDDKDMDGLLEHVRSRVEQVPGHESMKRYIATELLYVEDLGIWQSLRGRRDAQCCFFYHLPSYRQQELMAFLAENPDQCDDVDFSLKDVGKAAACGGSFFSDSADCPEETSDVDDVSNLGVKKLKR